MRKIKAGNLVEYILPLTLVGVVLGTSIYFMADSGLLQTFYKGSTGGNVSNKTLVINKVTTIPYLTISPGSLQGTRKNPVMQCVNGQCNIDFGDYILRGVPENIKDIASIGKGGQLSDTYANLLLQLSNQIGQLSVDKTAACVAGVDNKGGACSSNADVQFSINQKNILNRLATQGKLMANIERGNSENAVKSNTYFKKAVDDNNISGVLTSINPTKYKRDDSFKIAAMADYLSSQPKKANDVYKTDKEAALDKKQQFIWQDQKSDLTYASMLIYKDSPRLQSWQTKFISDMSTAKTSADVRKIAENVKQYLPQAEKDRVNNDIRLVDYVLHEAPSKTTGKSSQFASIRSVGKDGPGKAFNDILTKDVPKAKFPPDVLKIVNSLSKEIQIAGNYTTDQNEPEGITYKNSFKLDLNPIGQKLVNKTPAQTIVDTVKIASR